MTVKTVKEPMSMREKAEIIADVFALRERKIEANAACAAAIEMIGILAALGLLDHKQIDKALQLATRINRSKRNAAR